jgi:uncharacterized membrane protein YcaP (DUF421 family)
MINKFCFVILILGSIAIASMFGAISMLQFLMTFALIFLIFRVVKLRKYNL